MFLASGSRLTILVVVQLTAAMVSGPTALQAQEGNTVVASRGDLAVPVALPVATRRLARGTVLGAGDFTLARVVPRAPASRVATPVAPGWVARRVIQAGEILRAPAVAPAPLVAAGQTVHFTYQQDGLALSLDGVAPVAGSLGDTIPVRLGARRRVTGVVAGPSLVVAIDPSRNP